MKKIYDGLRRLNNHFVYSARYDLCADWTPSERLSFHRLDPAVEAHSEPEAFRSIISRSENHLEVADWGYIGAGPVAMLALICFIFGVTFFTAFFMTAVNNDVLNITDRIIGLCFAALIFLPPAIFGARPLYLQLTSHTHYPVRLDRRNQTVHVFRNGSPNGVVSIPWNELTFGIGAGESQSGVVNRAICGYRERSDGTFDWFHIGSSDRDPVVVIQQWEYFRRFMEEGLQGLPEPPVMLGIDRRRESFPTGAMHCWLGAGSRTLDKIPALVFTVPGSLIRWLAMRVAQRPSWPEHILAMTPIAESDPYVNKPEPRKDVCSVVVWGVTLGVLAFDVLWAMALFHFVRR